MLQVAYAVGVALIAIGLVAAHRPVMALGISLGFLIGWLVRQSQL